MKPLKGTITDPNSMNLINEKGQPLPPMARPYMTVEEKLAWKDRLIEALEDALIDAHNEIAALREQIGE